MFQDEVLVAEALAKGAEGFAPIVRQYQSAVFAVALARVRDFHEAEDIAQAVFVDAFMQLERLQEPRRLGAWLRTMAINKSIDRLRRRRDKVQLEQVADDPQLVEMHSALQGDEVRDQVLEAITRLGRAQQETITLHYLSGYSIKEIARIQGAAVGTVKARLHHGRKALKRDMIEMVKTTLQSAGPGQDLAQRVFELLCQHDKQNYYDMFQALRQMEASNGGIEGFVRAAESPSAETRRTAMCFVGVFAATQDMGTAIELVKRGLRDPNRRVRARAVRAALGQPEISCGTEAKRQHFVPLIVDLLFDAAKDVRQGAADQLRAWAADVPVDKAARALLDEPNRLARLEKEALLRDVLDCQFGEGPKMVHPSLVEEIAACRQALGSPNKRRRAKTTAHLMHLAMSHPEKGKEIVPLVVGMLEDPARGVRFCAAYSLRAWAGEVPFEKVERALRAEANPRVRAHLEIILQQAKAE